MVKFIARSAFNYCAKLLAILENTTGKMIALPDSNFLLPVILEIIGCTL